VYKHTPGPWRISADGNDVENDEGAGVCALYADETADANAALIAAAPELLEALAYLLPRAHRHLCDGAKLRQIAALADRANGRDPDRPLDA
jgi:hypothetical protein